MLRAIDCSPSVSRAPDEAGTHHPCTSVASQPDANHKVAGIVWIGNNIVNHIFVVCFYAGALRTPMFLPCKMVNCATFAGGCKAVRMSLTPSLRCLPAASRRGVAGNDPLLHLPLECIASCLTVPGVECHSLRFELILHGALCTCLWEGVHDANIARHHKIGHVRFAVLHQF